VTVELDLVADEAFLRIMSEVAFVLLMLTNNYKSHSPKNASDIMASHSFIFNNYQYHSNK
jgi:hypothetical protein